MVRHDPESYQESEEAEYVQEQDDSFGQWEMLCEEHVEAHGQNDEQKHDEGCLPRSREVCVLVNDSHHVLHDSGELEAARRDSGYPAETAAPSDDV